MNVMLMLAGGVLEASKVAVAVAVDTVLSIPGVRYIDEPGGAASGGGVLISLVTVGGLEEGESENVVVATTVVEVVLKVSYVVVPGG